jgi:type II secretory pathway pseudopilin PulG
MVIVLIVMSLTALLAPSAVRGFAIFRAQSASLEVLRMARIGRREAMEGGRAIVIRNAGGIVEVRRGTTNLCRTSAWADQFADPCATGADLSVTGTSCLGFLDPNDFTVGSHSVTITSVDGQDICYQPNGDGFLGPTGGTVFTRPTVGGPSAISYAVRRLESGAVVDPVRTIIFPVDSSPRSVR